MDYKEKYEQALERARQFSEKPYLEDSAGIVEYIFPELNESDDERIRKVLLDFLKNELKKHGNEEWDGGFHTTDVIAWLEKQGEIIKEWSEMKINNIQTELQEMVKLKQKMQGEQKSVEERQYTRKIIDTTTNEVIGYQTDDGLFTPETRPAWSEEDEVHVNSLLKRLEGLCRNEFAMTRFAINEDEDWLKSLKDRVQPQNTWKPSDEQIEILEMVLTNESMDDNIARILRELREQLKKLMEE